LKRSVLPAISAIVLLARVVPAQQGQLDASPSLFTILAAINSAGYDDGLDSPLNDPLRKAIRAEIAKRDIPSLPAIRAFVAKHHKAYGTEELGQYISFALTAGPPPDFVIRQRPVDIPPDVVPLRELSALMSAFYKEAHIAELWQKIQPDIDRLVDPYHDGVIADVIQANAYLRQDMSGFKGSHFQIFLEPQGAPGQMQTRRYATEYTVVITPSAKPRLTEVRHAYLYYLLDPLATRYQEILMRKKPLADHALRAKLLGDAYKQDFLLLATGSLVRAVEARMDRTPKTVDQALHEGYILTPYFYEALQNYEKQEVGMVAYYSGMVQAIDLYKEDRRLIPVDFDKGTAPPAAPALPPPDPKTVTPPVYEMLNQAEELFKKKDYEKAEPLFQDVSQQNANKRAQSAGYYGLARIALAGDQAEDAETLLESVLEGDPEPQIKAWTYVYLGKLRLEVMDKEEAAKFFQDALRVDGVSDPARVEAEQGLQKSQKK